MSEPATIVWFVPTSDDASSVATLKSLIEVADAKQKPMVAVIDFSGRAEELEAFLAAPLSRKEPFEVVLHIDPDEKLRALAAAHDRLFLHRGVSARERADVIAAAAERAKARRRPTPPPISPCLNVARFTIRTLDEADALATFLASLCTESERRVGGLLELLVNAIEHGNLEISSDEKQALVVAGQWFDEVKRRLNLPRYLQRRVRVEFRRLITHIEISIEDDGRGFEESSVLGLGLDQRVVHHGRGIALARMMSFDELRYEGSGNRVVGVIR